jgi:peptidoglycan biosynthesis protein MviN/MurJ (putative lipid II flippase)
MPVASQETSETADVLAVVALIISVIYASDEYDAWDIGLAILALYLCRRRLLTIPDRERNSSTTIIVILGIAMAILVLVYGIIALGHSLWLNISAGNGILAFLRSRGFAQVGIVLLLYWLVRWRDDVRRKKLAGT